MELKRTTLLMAVFARLAFSQGIITTAVGSDPTFQDNGQPAKRARIGQSGGVVVAPDGTVYFSDYSNRQVYKVGADGIIRIVAGNGLRGISGDGGPASGSTVNYPLHLALDNKGNMYIADAFNGADDVNGRIRKVTPDGTISTVAGSGNDTPIGDEGLATKASLFQPYGVAVDSIGNIYIADTGHNRIRKVTTDGIIHTIAGTGDPSTSGDGGLAINAAIKRPQAVAVDPDGNVFVAETDGARIRKINVADGKITTFAANIPALQSVQFANGVLYVTSFTRVFTVAPDGTVQPLAGTEGVLDFTGDGGKATAALLNLASDAARGPDGTVYIADAGNFRIRAVDPSGNISTFAGNGLYRASPEGAPASAVQLFGPFGISFDGPGNLYIAEVYIARVRRMAPDGTVFRVAGTGRIGPVINGILATQASLNQPSAVAVDANGLIYIADSEHLQVRKIDGQGIISLFAGGGSSQAEGVAATTAFVNSPRGLTVDSAGVVYISDTGNNKVRRVTKDGLINTVAGTGVAAFNGDVTATQSSLNGPKAIAFDKAGNLYIADDGNHRVRMVTSDGKISTIAGNGNTGSATDGAVATSTPVQNPVGLAVDAAGQVYVAASNKVYRISPDGILHILAGSGLLGFSGDGGPALQATFAGIEGVAVDASGNVYISDTGNDRVRVVLQAPPAFHVAPSSLSFSASAGGSRTAVQTLSVTTSVPGSLFTISNNLPAWLSVSPLSGSLPTVLQVFADPGSLAPGPYNQAITINVPTAVPPSRTVNVSFTVGSAAPPKLSVSDTNLSFAFSAQFLTDLHNVAISNAGGGSLSFTATASTTSGGNWLSVTLSSGTAAAGNPVLVGVRADASNLAPGVYLGQVTITSSTTNERTLIAVTMTISGVRQTIQLSQSGLTFTAVAGGGFVLPQSFSVLNTGQGIMDWTATPATLSGGAWLSVTPASGSTDASSTFVPAVQVSVNATALAAGTYYGRVAVTATSADNSPQLVLVVLNVLPAGTNPGPLVQPTALVFTGIAGGATPSSQNISIGNAAGSSLAYVSGRLTLDGVNWFQAVPGSGSVPRDQPATIVIQPVTDGLTAGVRRGVLTLLFTDGSTRTENLLLVLTPVAGGSSASREAEGCTPTKLLPQITSIGQDFNIPAAWPIALVAKIVDDCGNAMVSGSVTASFSNGDPQLSLKSLKDGSWSETWQPRNTQVAFTTITVSAQIPEQSIQGSIQITGGLNQNVDPPQISPGAVLSAASFAQQSVIAPGSIVSIFGLRFADGINIASTLPLATVLVGTEVYLGGRSLPLFFTSAGQINAIVPNSAPINSQAQMAVRRGSTLSGTEPVTVAAAQPAVFTPSQSGKGQGFVMVHAPSGTETIADNLNPAHVDDVLVIYCAGLGLTDPAVEAGTPSSLTTLSQTVNPVTVSIGGQNATVAFAGLTPGFVGLYQVNTVVPAGVTPSDQVPVILSVGGQSSPAVTMSVR